jgi:bacteriocin-like protein
MTHEVKPDQFAARDANTLTESELDTVSGGTTAEEEAWNVCTGLLGLQRALNVWNYALGKAGY